MTCILTNHSPWYDLYITFNANEAWRLPELHGALPTLPDETSSATVKGHFALYGLLLLTPWRCIERDLLVRAGRKILRGLSATPTMPVLACIAGGHTCAALINISRDRSTQRALSHAQRLASETPAGGPV